jgi:16S rRNA (uracil1498-N3)-methyltransferase
VPGIEPVGCWEDILRRRKQFDTGIMFWEGAQESLTAMPASESETPRKVLAVIGPEGGFSEEEAAAAEQAGFQLVTLGPRILRAETAAVAAGALVQHLYGDLRKAMPQESSTESE